MSVLSNFLVPGTWWYLLLSKSRTTTVVPGTTCLNIQTYSSGKYARVPVLNDIMDKIKCKALYFIINKNIIIIYFFAKKMTLYAVKIILVVSLTLGFPSSHFLLVLLPFLESEHAMSSAFCMKVGDSMAKSYTYFNDL